MKNISINNIIDPSSLQPFTGNSLKFLQDYLTEDKAAIVKALIISNKGSYSLNTPYVISGCVVSDTNKDVTDGEIFYDGAFYQLTGVNGTTNTAQFILTKTNSAPADPLEFSDGQTWSVHDIYKYVGTDTATPGDFASTDLVSAFVAWESYVPTLTGATGTLRNASYLFKDNKLSMVFDYISVTTSGASSIDFTLPFAIPSPKLAIGYSSVDYYDGTNSFIAKASIRLLHSGAGTALRIENADNSAFGSVSGGTFKFSIEIAFV